MLRTMPILIFVLSLIGSVADGLAAGPSSPVSVGLLDTLSRGKRVDSGPITTFSIVAYDPETGDYGVGVQSKYFSVGDVVPFAKADIGALATQAMGNPLHGPAGLKLFGDGVFAEEALRQIIEADSKADFRQLGMVDREGRPVTYTGKKCLPWAGGLTGINFAVQGNLLAGPQVVEAMAATFEAALGDLATRLVYALAAGQAAGGDARGRQSAAVLVVRKEAGYLGLNDRHIDLHVEDHATPIKELKRLLDIRHAQLAAVQTQDLLVKAEAAKGQLRSVLVKQARVTAEQGVDFYSGDDYLWWLVARTRLLDGDLSGAVEAGRNALLISPFWPRLPETTREELGLDAALVSKLQGDDGFFRLWQSLAAKESVQ